MKKYICILAGAALLAACEQKTETVTPATTPAPTTPPPATTEVTSPAATEAPAATTDSPAGAPRKHLPSRPRNKAGILSFEKSSPDFRWKTSFVLSRLDLRIATAS